MFRSFGYLAENKRVPDWCLTAPIEFVQGFIDGFTEGDGHRFKGNSITLTSTSHSLLFGIRLMLARLGIVAWTGTSKPAGIRNIFGRERQCLAAHTLTFTDRKRSWFGVVNDIITATHVEIAERVDQPVHVFNLAVQEDESYVTAGGTVHNCLSQAFSYLSDRGILDATPNEKYVDLEEKKEVEEQAARREYERENAKRRVNPYG
jgi:intein/homing endonuclease